MKKYTNEFKVGILVIACILGFFYLIFSTGKMNIKKEGYEVYVIFNDVAGLQTKAPVMLNGLEVGKVEEIKTVYQDDSTMIKLRLWVDAKARIRQNPAVSIKTLGLMGEKFVQISSGSGKDFVAPGVILYGKPYLDLDALLEQTQQLSSDLGKQVNMLVVSLNSTVTDNKPNINQIIKNLEATSRNFEEFSDDIKRHPWKLLLKSKEKPQK